MTSDDLRTVRAHLQRYGWLQGSYGAPGGPRCIIGAITDVTGGMHTDRRFAAYRAIAALVLADDRYHGIADWNDAPGRTAAEVYELIDKAIAAAIEKERK